MPSRGASGCKGGSATNKEEQRKEFPVGEAPPLKRSGAEDCREPSQPRTSDRSLRTSEQTPNKRTVRKCVGKSKRNHNCRRQSHYWPATTFDRGSKCAKKLREFLDGYSKSIVNHSATRLVTERCDNRRPLINSSESSHLNIAATPVIF